MQFRNTITALLGSTALAGAALLASVGPASAATACTGGTACAGASVNVATVVSLTGIQDVNFGNVTAGTTASQPTAESFTVSTNSPHGYTLTGTAGANSFSGAGSIPNTPNWTITANGTHSNIGGTGYNPSTTATQLGAFGAPTTDTYTEAWSLAVPTNTPAGAESNTLTYLVIANP